MTHIINNGVCGDVNIGYASKSISRINRQSLCNAAGILSTPSSVTVLLHLHGSRRLLHLHLRRLHQQVFLIYGLYQSHQFCLVLPRDLLFENICCLPCPLTNLPITSHTGPVDLLPLPWLLPRIIFLVSLSHARMPDAFSSITPKPLIPSTILYSS